jgi:hypothetical protein
MMSTSNVYVYFSMVQFSRNMLLVKLDDMANSNHKILQYCGLHATSFATICKYSVIYSEIYKRLNNSPSFQATAAM